MPDLKNNDTSASLAGNSSTRSSCFERFYTPKVCLVVFTLVNLFTYYDRGAVSAMLTNIRSDSVIAGEDGTISEARGGAIVSAFMVGYMIACPVFASLGRYFSTRALITTGLSVWVVTCVATGLVQNYYLLVLVRMFVGIGESSYAGFFITILDNIAPKTQRTSWIGIFYAMLPAGTAFGMLGSALVAANVNIEGIVGWRIVFFTEVIVAIPVMVLACMFPSKYAPTTVGTTEPQPPQQQEPRQQQHQQLPQHSLNPVTPAISLLSMEDNNPQHPQEQEPHSKTSESEVAPLQSPKMNINTDYGLIINDTNDSIGNAPNSNTNGEEDETRSHADPLTAFKHLLCNLDYLLVVLGYGMYSFVIGAIAVWAISALTQGPWHFSDVGASAAVGGIVALTGLVGSICGGLFVDHIGGSRGWGGIYKCLLFSTCMMIIVLPFGISSLFLYSKAGVVTLFAISVFFIFLVTAPINSSIISIVPLNIRTYAMSFSVLLIHLFGDFPSPTITGAIADSFDEGCSALKHNWECGNATANHCFWVPEKNGSNAHCVNEYETRNALTIVFACIGFAIPVWTWAAFRARVKWLNELRSKDSLILNNGYDSDTDIIVKSPTKQTIINNTNINKNNNSIRN